MFTDQRSGMPCKMFSHHILISECISDIVWQDKLCPWPSYSFIISGAYLSKG